MRFESKPTMIIDATAGPGRPDSPKANMTPRNSVNIIREKAMRAIAFIKTGLNLRDILLQAQLVKLKVHRGCPRSVL